MYIKYIFIFIAFFFTTLSADTNNLQNIITQLETLDQNRSTNEKDIDDIVTKKSILYDEIITLIKKDKIVYIDIDQNRLNFLNQRVSINRQRENNIAVDRDNIELKYISLNQTFNTIIKSIITSRNKYHSETHITKNIKENLLKIESIKLNKDEIIRFEKFKDDKSGYVTIELYENFLRYKKRVAVYEDIVKHLLQSTDILYKRNFIIHSLNIDYIANIISNIPIIKEINIYLEYYLKINFSKLLISLFLFFIILVSSKLITKYTIFILEYLTNKRDSCSIRLHYFLYDVLKKPIFLLSIVLSVEILIRLSITDSYYIEKIIGYINPFYLFLLAYTVYSMIDNSIIYFSESFIEHSSIKQELINFVIKMIKFILLIVIILIVLKQMGYNITAIVASLGIGGIAIALAAKDTLSNLFGSFNIMLDDVYSQGDLIESDKVKGHVVEIGIRSTTIRTFDNALVTVPNAYLAETFITNWSRRKAGRELKISLTFTYQSKKENIEKTVEDIKHMLYNHQDIADDRLSVENIKTEKIIKKEDFIGVKKMLKVHFFNFNAYSIDIQVYCFTKSISYEEWLDTKEDILYKIWDIVEQNSLEFAYPTQTLFLEKNSST
jgi:MscS family membrane protein